MAIVNEDPVMVKFILEMDEWALHKTRCIGSFFSANDQRDSRTDSVGTENMDIKLNTNYQGELARE